MTTVLDQLNRKLWGHVERWVRPLAAWHLRRHLVLEYRQQVYSRMNERPIEWRFALQQAMLVSPQTILDVGTGRTAFPHLLHNCGFVVTAIDNVSDYWKPGAFSNRHFHVIDDNILRPKLTGEFDMVTCISVLEHIPAHHQAIDSMLALLKPGGHLMLTFPYNENRYVENVYKLPEAGYGQKFSYPCQVYSRAELNRWLRDGRARIVEQEYWQFFSGELWTFGEPLRPPRQVGPTELHQLTCLLIQKSLTPDTRPSPTHRSTE